MNRRLTGACGHSVYEWPQLFTRDEWREHQLPTHLCVICEEWVTALHTGEVAGQQELPFGD